MPDQPAPASPRENHGFARVVAVSPELVLGDVGANLSVLKRELAARAGQGARLIVFPELCLTGYSCADLFHHAALLKRAQLALAELAEGTAGLGCVAVVGLPLTCLWNVGGVALKDWLQHGRRLVYFNRLMAALLMISLVPWLL